MNTTSWSVQQRTVRYLIVRVMQGHSSSDMITQNSTSFLVAIILPEASRIK